VFPIEGSPNATSFYYISQRPNLGYSGPVLGMSADQNGNSIQGGGECFTLNAFLFQLQADNRTVVVATNVPFNEGTLEAVNGMTLAINTPNATYNGNYVASWGVVNGNSNEFSYVLPAAPTGSSPTSGTASFCNMNYKLYPGVRVNSVLNPATNRVDGTMETMPSPVAFTAGDSVMEPHYPWIYTAHDSGRGVAQFIPRFYQGGSLYGMSYNYLLTGRPFQGFSINNATDQNRYLKYGGTHQPPGSGFNLWGEWDDSLMIGQAPDEALIRVNGCKPNPIGCGHLDSNFNLLLMPNAGQALNYDPQSQTWTFGANYYPQNTPVISPGGTVQAWNVKGLNTVGVGGAYLFNLGGAIGISSNQASPSFNQWFANYAYGFGAQNTTAIDGYLYHGPTADSISCGTGTGNTSCTFTGGTLNAGTAVNAPTIAASSSITTPGLTVGGGSTVTHVGYLGTASITPAAVPAQSCSDQAFAVTGVQVADDLGSVKPPAALGNVSVSGYASGAGQVTLHFCNVSATAVTPPAGVYSFLAMR
jgi:hypothetical protein